MSAHRDLTRGDGRLRIASWRGDTTTAYLTPARGRPSVTAIERSLGINQDVGDILDVAHFLVAAPHLQQRIVSG